jgi:hypothetical protein
MKINDITDVRHTLLSLHKALLDAQRIRYEREHGRIETSFQFLGLVVAHPEFAWIRSLSALIAEMDEWSEAGDPARQEELAALLETLRSLIQPEGPNAAFSGPYWKIVEAEPDVLVEHVKLWRMLGQK